MATEKQTHANQENENTPPAPRKKAKPILPATTSNTGSAPQTNSSSSFPAKVWKISSIGRRTPHGTQLANRHRVPPRRSHGEVQWMRARAAQLQTKTICLEPEDHDKKLNLYMRYATAHEKSFYKALNTLKR